MVATKGIDYWKYHLDVDITSASAWLGLIKFHMDCDEFSLAEKYISQAVNYLEDGVDLDILRAEIAFRKGEFEKSVKIARKVLDDVGDESWMWEIRVMSLIFLGSMEEAKRENNTALILFPNHLTFKLLSARTDFKEKRLSLAQEKVAELLRDFAGVSEVHDLASDICLAAEDIECAENHIRECIAIKPDNIVVINKLGWILFGQDKFEMANNEFVKSKNVYANQSEAYLGIAHCFYKNGEFENALEQCEAGVLHEENDVRIWQLMFMLAHKLNDKNLARKPVEMLKKLSMLK